MENRKLHIISGLIFTFLLSIGIMASPTIIQDSRIRDTAATPVLGRGYSIATNTFQSTCMDNVITTPPSYDFTYSFKSLEEEDETTSTKIGTGEKSLGGPKTVSDTVKGSWELKGWSQWSGSAEYREIIQEQKKKIGKETVKEGKKYYSHVVNVTIDIHSYYASVDESKSKLSETAGSLLNNNDIPGFFSSCGPYYVRSIGRKATFKSFFEYKTESTKKDTSFEGQLETMIKSFGQYKYQQKYGNQYSGGGTTTSELGAKTKNDELKEQFSEEASSKSLMITSIAFGLGKNEKASIISYDLDSFKVAIKDAFMSMQDVMTGKVSSIEVVPWVENTHFQNLVKISQPTFIVYTKPDGSKDQREMSLYEKKHILNLNAEFLIEIDRADRNFMNMYYKANLCKKNIRVNWFKKDEATGNILNELADQYKNSEIYNNYNLNKTIKLSQFLLILSDDNIEKILKTERSFMYGDPSKKFSISSLSGTREVVYQGAVKCMRDIMNEGIYKKEYREIESCIPVNQWIGEILNDTIDSYCMPQLKE